MVQKLRRVPFAIKDRVVEELCRLEAAGIIEKIDGSEWVHGLVPVVKPDGSIRICVDLQELNKCVVMDQYPLPTVDELTLEVGNSTKFSKLDLKKAFYQVELDPESRPMTAFITDIGLFQFRRMPMGLNSAPAAFQKIIDHILQGLPGHSNGQDDVLIFGNGDAEHDQRLRDVLQRLSDAGACLEAKKLKIGKSELEFYGHKVSAKGIMPKDSNVQAILEMPAPTDTKAGAIVSVDNLLLLPIRASFLNSGGTVARHASQGRWCLPVDQSGAVGLGASKESHC